MVERELSFVFNFWYLTEFLLMYLCHVLECDMATAFVIINSTNTCTIQYMYKSILFITKYIYTVYIYIYTVYIYYICIYIYICIYNMKYKTYARMRIIIK